MIDIDTTLNTYIPHLILVAFHDTIDTLDIIRKLVT